MWLVILILFSFSFAQETYYCVQLASSKTSQSLHPLLLKVKDLPKARIEKIQGLYTLRVGFYKEINRAKKILKEVKRRNFKDAFLRTCYYIPSRIIVSNFSSVEKKEERSEEFYRLLVQSLLGGKKLKSALEAIEKAVKKFPDNPYWWKLYGDVLLWNSKPQEALEAYLKTYELTPSKSLAKKIFNLAVSLSRFDVAKQFLEEVNPPPEIRIYVYESAGDIDSLIRYLRKVKTKEALIILAQVEFSLGNKENALKALELHDKLYGVSIESILLRTNILYSEKKFEDALRVLKENYEKFEDSIEYLRNLSDLAWMLGDYETAWKASEKLLALGKAEEVDYERLNYKYVITNPEKAIRLNLEAYEKFRKLFFLESAFFTAFTNGYFKKVLNITERYREILIKNPYAFSAYVIALDKIGKSTQALKLTEEYLSKEFNKEILRFYIYLLAEKKKFRKLRRILRKYINFEKDGELSLAFAYAYTVLQEGKKALAIYKASPKKDKVLYGDILYLLGKEEEAAYYRLRTLREMRKKLKRNPNLIKNPEFLRTYLSLGMEFMHPAEFERILQEARGILSEVVWKEIYLSYLLYKEQKVKVEWLAKIYKYPLKPWMWLNLALETNNKPLMEKLVDKEIDNLPTRDRVEALRRLGKPYKALYYAFLGLNSNPEDYKLYKQFRDLTVEWANTYKLESSYYSRKNLKEMRYKFELRRKLKSGKTFLNLRLFHGNSLEKRNLRKTPKRTELEVSFERVYRRGKLGFGMGVLSGIRDKPSLSFYISRLFRRKLLAELKFGKNARSEETLYLYLGGMKDFARLTINYPFTNRFFGYFSGEYALFRAQDETPLGKGINLYGELSYKLRVGYPDYTLRIYGNYGNYAEKSSRGVLRQISPYEEFKVLPENFLSYGVGFLFGFENRYSFVRVWRPFISLDLGYNTGIKGLFFGGSLGVGGLIFGQDNLSLGIDYMENRGGVKEGILNLNLLYRRWY